MGNSLPNNVERIVKLKNDKLYDLLKQKTEAVSEGQAIFKEKEEVEKRLNKAGLKIQKYKDKIVPLVQGLTKNEVGAFEDLVSVNIKDGEIILTIVDKVEEFKNRWLEAKYEATKKPDDRTKS